MFQKDVFADHAFLAELMSLTKISRNVHHYRFSLCKNALLLEFITNSKVTWWHLKFSWYFCYLLCGWRFCTGALCTTQFVQVKGVFFPRDEEKVGKLRSNGQGCTSRDVHAAAAYIHAHARTTINVTTLWKSNGEKNYITLCNGITRPHQGIIDSCSVLHLQQYARKSIMTQLGCKAHIPLQKNQCSKLVWSPRTLYTQVNGCLWSPLITLIDTLLFTLWTFTKLTSKLF